MLHDLLGEARDVGGARVLPLAVVAAGIGELRVGEAEHEGAAVHGLDEYFYRTAQMLGERPARIVRRAHHRRGEEIARAQLLARLEPDARAGRLQHAAADFHRLIEPAALEGDERGHQLGEAGRGESCLGLAGPQDDAVALDQVRAGDPGIRIVDGMRRAPGEPCREDEREANHLAAEEPLELVDSLLHLVAGARGGLFQAGLRQVGSAEIVVLAAHLRGVVAPDAVLLGDRLRFRQAVAAEEGERFGLRRLRAFRRLDGGGADAAGLRDGLVPSRLEEAFLRLEALAVLGDARVAALADLRAHLVVGVHARLAVRVGLVDAALAVDAESPPIHVLGGRRALLDLPLGELLLLRGAGRLHGRHVLVDLLHLLVALLARGDRVAGADLAAGLRHGHVAVLLALHRHGALELGARGVELLVDHHGGAVAAAHADGGAVAALLAVGDLAVLLVAALLRGALRVVPLADALRRHHARGHAGHAHGDFPKLARALRPGGKRQRQNGGGKEAHFHFRLSLYLFSCKSRVYPRPASG